MADGEVDPPVEEDQSGWLEGVDFAEDAEDVAEELVAALERVPDSETRAEALLYAAQSDDETLVSLVQQVTSVEPYTDADDLAKLRSAAPEIYEQILNEMKTVEARRGREFDLRLQLAKQRHAHEEAAADRIIDSDNEARSLGQKIAGSFAAGCLVVALVGAFKENAGIVAAGLSASAVGGIAVLARSWLGHSGEGNE